MRLSSLVLATALFAASVSPALAQDSGGLAAPSEDVAPAAVGGAATPPSGRAPVARLTVRSPTRGRPRIRVRFTGRGVPSVTARIAVLRTPGNAVAADFDIGTVATRHTLRVPWKGAALAPGEYIVRVHAHDQWNRQLRRLARASGKTRLVVRAPKPKPAPTPPDPEPVSPTGTYPVAGWHSYGSLFGEQRTGYRHQGVDILASEGTPVVAPLAGTVRYTDYQASAAGYYVVLDADDGHSFFFAHCQKKSTAVTPGQRVVSGAAICRVGQTGDATGPHLHFEEWTGGWRVDSHSAPIDPMPQLVAWDS